MTYMATMIGTYHKESTHEIWVQSGQWFVRKLFFYILMGPQYKRPWLKGKCQPLPLKLIYSHCLISFNMSSKNNHLGFNSIQKINFSKQKSHLNALGSNFDLDVGRPNTPNATYQVPRSSPFWFWRRRILKGVYHIWAWRPSWSSDQDHLKTLSFPRPQESPYEIWV